MKTNFFYLSLIFFCVAIFGCSGGAQSQSKKDKQKKHNKEEKYSEDISSYRVKHTPLQETVEEDPKKNQDPVKPEKHVTATLNAKMDTMSGKGVRSAPGYRIMVYSGRSSEEVKNTKTKVYGLIPEADIYSEFKSPNHRVKVGNCVDRQEAYYLFGKLKKTFPNAVIVPDQIVIKAK